jgi:hypothetical protein
MSELQKQLDALDSKCSAFQTKYRPKLPKGAAGLAPRSPSPTYPDFRISTAIHHQQVQGNIDHIARSRILVVGWLSEELMRLCCKTSCRKAPRLQAHRSHSSRSCTLTTKAMTCRHFRHKLRYAVLSGVICPKSCLPRPHTRSQFTVAGIGEGM